VTRAKRNAGSVHPVRPVPAPASQLITHAASSPLPQSDRRVFPQDSPAGPLSPQSKKKTRAAFAARVPISVL